VTLPAPTSLVPCRRRAIRLFAASDVWVYWEYDGRGDVSHVRDLSLAGLFIETQQNRPPKGDLVQVHFLVPEGQIRLEGIVAQGQSLNGFGLKFQAVTTEDVPKLITLMDRVRSEPLRGPASCRLFNFV
jgi:hypothetical protein